MELNLSATIAMVQAAHPDATVEVWAEDEARLGLKPVLRRVWAKRGQRPIAAVVPRYQWLSIYGCVQPSTGQTEWLILPTVRTDVLRVALAQFAAAVGGGPRTQVVLVLDQAGWHTSAALAVPAGVHLVALPAHTPELQPAERLWPLVRAAVANESSTDLDALKARLAERCQALLAVPAVIKAHTSIGGRSQMPKIVQDFVLALE